VTSLLSYLESSLSVTTSRSCRNPTKVATPQPKRVASGSTRTIYKWKQHAWFLNRVVTATVQTDSEMFKNDNQGPRHTISLHKIVWYCNKKMKRHSDKKIFFFKILFCHFKIFSHTRKKILDEKCLIIFLSRNCARKCLLWRGPNSD
jgi:hypothetical protein